MPRSGNNEKKAESGEEIWCHGVNAPEMSGPVISDGLVYVGGGGSGEKGAMRALDLQSGEIVWEFETRGWVPSATVIDEIVYFGGSDDQIYGLNKRTGEKEWEYSQGKGISTKIAVYGEVLCFGCQDKSFYAVNLDTSQELWKFKTLAGGISDPLIDQGRVFFGSHSYDDPSLYALDLWTGKTIWSFPSGLASRLFKTILYLPVGTDLTLAGELICFGTREGVIHALDKRKGEKIWEIEAVKRHDLNGSYRTSLTCDGHHVYFVDRQYLRQVGLKSGKEYWRFLAVRDPSTPTYWDHQLFFGASDTQVRLLYCVYARNGQLKWKRDCHYASHLPDWTRPAVCDNVACFGDRANRWVHAIAV